MDPHSLPRPNKHPLPGGLLRATRDDGAVFGFETKQLLGQLSDDCRLDGGMRLLHAFFPPWGWERPNVPFASAENTRQPAELLSLGGRIQPKWRGFCATRASLSMCRGARPTPPALVRFQGRMSPPLRGGPPAPTRPNDRPTARTGGRRPGPPPVRSRGAVPGPLRCGLEARSRGAVPGPTCSGEAPLGRRESRGAGACIAAPATPAAPGGSR